MGESGDKSKCSQTLGQLKFASLSCTVNSLCHCRRYESITTFPDLSFLAGSKLFTYISSFTPHNHAMRIGTIIPFYSRENLCVCVFSCSAVPHCNPMDCSPPGSPVHGILQARILEWVAILFSRGSSPNRDRTHVSCVAGRFFTV